MVTNVRPTPDRVLLEIADYVCTEELPSDEAYETARYALMDSLACAFHALDHEACRRMIGPVVPGATLADGARVPGCTWELDPVTAAFNISTMIRWLDFNDTWLAAEWAHPSDNLGAILAAADYVSRLRRPADVRELRINDVLTYMIRAYEIQGILALQNSFNRVGLDHVILVRVASAAIATRLLGGDRQQVVDAISQAWIDGGTLRTYRHAPNTGSRKSWAAADAASRGVRLALITMNGEMGYPAVLNTEKWGFTEVLLAGNPVTLARPLGSYVMENILFKVSYPAEFHGQTAIEAAIQLHRSCANRINQIDHLVVETQEPAIRIIDKSGPLANPADRDHCLQYMIAIGLLFGQLDADDYSAERACDPRIDDLRSKMKVVENSEFTRDYYDLDKRHISNAIQIVYADGTSSERVCVEAPIGHRNRRTEALPLIEEKFKSNLSAKLPMQSFCRLEGLVKDLATLRSTPLNEFMTLVSRDCC